MLLVTISPEVNPVIAADFEAFHSHGGTPKTLDGLVHGFHPHHKGVPAMDWKPPFFRTCIPSGNLT